MTPNRCPHFGSQLISYLSKGHQDQNPRQGQLSNLAPGQTKKEDKLEPPQELSLGTSIFIDISRKSGTE